MKIFAFMALLALQPVFSASAETAAVSENKFFGKPIRAQVKNKPLAEGDGFESSIPVRILSKKDRSLLKGSVRLQASETTGLLEGETEFYWNGIQLNGPGGRWKDGSYVYEIGIPPVRMRIPIVQIPVGPIQIGVDTGILGSAQLHASATPELGWPLEMVALSGRIGPQIQAGAFLEGYAKFLMVRGGLGGELRLIEGDAGAEGRVYLKGRQPEWKTYGWVEFLSGDFYAFVDIYNVFALRWKRLIQPVIRHWKGKCISLGGVIGDQRCGSGSTSPSSPSLD